MRRPRRGVCAGLLLALCALRAGEVRAGDDAAVEDVAAPSSDVVEAAVTRAAPPPDAAGLLDPGDLAALQAVQARVAREDDPRRRISLVTAELARPNLSAPLAAALADAALVLRALADRGALSAQELARWWPSTFSGDAAGRAQAVAAAQGGAEAPGLPAVPAVELEDGARADWLRVAHEREFAQRQMVLTQRTAPDPTFGPFAPPWRVRTGDGISLGPWKFARITGDLDRLRRLRGEAALIASAVAGLSGTGASLLATALRSQVIVDDGEAGASVPTMPLRQAEAMATVGAGLIAAALPTFGGGMGAHATLAAAYRLPRARDQVGRYNDRLRQELGLGWELGLWAPDGARGPGLPTGLRLTLRW